MHNPKVFLRRVDQERLANAATDRVFLEDYRRAFGEDPPAEASLAIMNDSDDTGQSAVSFVEFIEVFR